MRYLLLLLLPLAAARLPYSKNKMLETNRIPEAFDGALYTPVRWDKCSECKIVIRKVMEVIDNPTRLAELKVVLSLLCDFSGNPPACKLAVATIDIFIKHLDPYLKHPEIICQKLRLCSQPPTTFVSQYPRALPNVSCDECQGYAVDYKYEFDDPRFQKYQLKKIKEKCEKEWRFRPAQKVCEWYEVKVFHLFLYAMDKMLESPEGFCMFIGLCPIEDVLSVDLRFDMISTVNIAIDDFMRDLEQNIKNTGIGGFMEELAPVGKHSVITDDATGSMDYELSCEDCQTLFRNGKKLVDDPKWREMNKNNLENNHCKQYGYIRRHVCNWLVEKFLARLYAALEETFADPLGECTKLKYCPDPSSRLEEVSSEEHGGLEFEEA